MLHAQNLPALWLDANGNYVEVSTNLRGIELGDGLSSGYDQLGFRTSGTGANLVKQLGTTGIYALDNLTAFIEYSDKEVELKYDSYFYRTGDPKRSESQLIPRVNKNGVITVERLDYSEVWANGPAKRTYRLKAGNNFNINCCKDAPQILLTSKGRYYVVWSHATLGQTYAGFRVEKQEHIHTISDSGITMLVFGMFTHEEFFCHHVCSYEGKLPHALLEALSRDKGVFPKDGFYIIGRKLPNDSILRLSVESWEVKFHAEDAWRCDNWTLYNSQ